METIKKSPGTAMSERLNPFVSISIGVTVGAVAGIAGAYSGAFDAFFMWLPMLPLYLIAGLILAFIVWAVFSPFIILMISIVCMIVDAFTPKSKTAKDNSKDKAADADLESVTIEVREPESWLSKGLKLYGAYHLLGFGKNKTKGCLDDD
jgi:hypothetical protein